MAKKRRRSSSSKATTATTTPLPSSPPPPSSPSPLTESTLKGAISTCVSAPEGFLVAGERVDDAREGVRAFFDFEIAQLKKDEILEEIGADAAPSSLYVTEMEPEQIWAQLNLLNEPLIESCETIVSSLLSNRKFNFDAELSALMPPSKKARMPEAAFDEAEFDRFMELEDMGEDFSVGSNSSDMESVLESGGEESGLESDDEAETSEALKEKKKLPSAKKNRSRLEDDFLDFEAMERFVEEAEQIERGITPMNVDEVDEEEAMALLYGEGADEEEDSEDSEEEGTGKGMDRMDVDEADDSDDGFIDNTEKDLDRLLDEIEAADGISSTSKKKEKAEKRSVKKLKYGDWFAEAGTNRYTEVESDSEDSEDEKEKALERGMSKYEREQVRMRKMMREAEKKNLAEGDAAEESLSRYAMKQARMQSKIEKLEEENMANRPWQLMGESRGTKRPKNSLLEEQLEFDYANKVAPVVTQEVTKSIEEMIKYRILNVAFDDVIRKVFEDDHNKGDFRESAVELDSTKSKKDLAELYEDEYTNAAESAIDPKSELKDELGRLFKAIVFKLDALSNFNAAPRRTKDAVDIRALKSKNASSITMEEVTPVTVSDASLFTPEEIYKRKKGKLVGESELERADKQRIRRAKKDRYGKGEANRENKKAEKKRAVLARESDVEKARREQKEFHMEDKEEAAAALKKGNDKSVSFIKNTDTTNYGQSTSLFNKLQQEAEAEAKGLLGKNRLPKNSKKRKKGKDASASEVNRFKL
eukprot:TRINITY_DN10973_c0_g1_i1.p1 TRINITY_DN10973_c0_g1~~TRINITY_DN10973_c0_g1_i1.p1  ORF type:complete len:760 (+),score=298.31 TRINITY_DN10973_c0_g1_i1:118-2397(+)